MEADLIPGLTDCIALECLLRLPFHAIPAARAVCRRWKHELSSPSFYRIRRATGLAHRVVTLLLRGKISSTVGKLHLALYEPATGVCMMRQLDADRPNDKKGCSNAAVIGRELVVIGGWDVLENRRTNEVNIYDLLSGAWRLGAPDPAPEQSFYRSGLKGGMLFLLGGRDDAEGKKIRSGLIYDVASDRWIEMPDLNTCIDSNSRFCDKFWQSRKEYNDAIRCFSEFLLLDGLGDLSLRTNEEEKEMTICVPGDKSGRKVMVEEVVLNENALGMMRRRLGLRPNQVGEYLQSYCFDWL